MEALKKRLEADHYALLQKNSKPVLYEPQVTAAAYAFAAVWDRVRYGALSANLAAAVLRQQAATLAACLAARPEQWPHCWQSLTFDEDQPLAIIYDAVALGWRLKWS